MENPRELRLRHFEQASGQRHIEATDRYLYRAADPTFTLNVIGTGTMGQEHMRVATLAGRAQVHGIYDSSPHSLRVAQEEFARWSSKRPVVYSDLQSACLDTNVDGLIICTPNATHGEVLRVAATSGKPILLEKPMATTLPAAAEIVKIADDYPAVLQIGLQYRYKPIYVEALHEAQQRRSLGQIKTISMQEHRPPFLDKVGQWNKFSASSGGTLVEKCCHYFDLINLLADATPQKVYASGSQAVNFREFEHAGRRADILDNAFVTIDYANGVRGSLGLNMFAPNFDEELVLCGDAGRLKASEHVDVFHHRSQAEVTVAHGETAASRRIEPTYPEFIASSGHSGATFFEHQAFMDQLEGRPVNSADVRQGFWSIVVAVAAERSVATGQPVDVLALLKAEGIEQVLDA